MKRGIVILQPQTRDKSSSAASQRQIELATIDNTVLISCSRNFRASFRNSLRRQHLPFFSSALAIRLPAKNSFSSIGGNRERLGSKKNCNFSIRGDGCAYFLFCSRQYVKRTNSPNARYPESNKLDGLAVKI